MEVEVPPLVASLFFIEPSEPAETAPPVMYAPCRAARGEARLFLGKKKVSLVLGNVRVYFVTCIRDWVVL